jgi:hypothetical protein
MSDCFSPSGFFPCTLYYYPPVFGRGAKISTPIFLCVLGVLCGFLLGNTTTKSTKDTKELTSLLRVLRACGCGSAALGVPWFHELSLPWLAHLQIACARLEKPPPPRLRFGHRLLVKALQIGKIGGTEGTADRVEMEVDIVLLGLIKRLE